MTDLAATTPALKPASPGERESYMPQLDGLRAIAVALVINHHFMPAAATWAFPGRSIIDRIEPSGVRLFFVLSGFLITGILLRGRTDAGALSTGASLKQFYIRRFLRIFPLYYAVLAAAAALNLPYVREALGWHAVYLTNVYYSMQGIWGDGPCSHFWSLAVEEQFYFAWPLLILTIPRRFLLPVISAAFFAGIAFRLFGCIRTIQLQGMYSDPVGVVYLPIGSLDSLGIGALLALAASPDFGSPALRRLIERVGFFTGLPIAAAAMLLTHLTWNYTWVITFFDTGMALFYAALVSRAAAGIRGPLGSALGCGPLAYIGRISYGVYVYHLFVFALLKPINFSAFPGFEHAMLYLCSVAATLAIASLSFFAFERPINNLKRLFPYQKRRASAPATVRLPESEPACTGAAT